MSESEPKDLVPAFAEGAEITHSSGAKYKRINGDWVLIEYPDGTKREIPPVA